MRLISIRVSKSPSPRITAELNAARPIDIAFIDGVETITGGEGPWIRSVKPVRPGIFLLGTNAVSTDAVATAAMGYDPRATRGQGVFKTCDNTLLLAEQLRLGSADVQQIDVRGLKLEDALYRFG